MPSGNVEIQLGLLRGDSVMLEKNTKVHINLKNVEIIIDEREKEGEKNKMLN